VVPRIATSLEVIFLRHYSERDRLTNTGNWASLALERSRVLEQGVPGAPLDASELDAPGTWLLYPSPHPPPPGTPPPRRLVVPDATWAQARRIVHRVPAIQRLPRLPLPVAVAAGASPGLRRPPRRGVGLGGMSTLEAVASALRVLGEAAAADRLEVLLADGVSLVTRLRGVPEAHASAGSLRGQRQAAGEGQG
jgi:DTW domain-containing protein YfiP